MGIVPQIDYTDEVICGQDPNIRTHFSFWLRSGLVLTADIRLISMEYWSGRSCSLIILSRLSKMVTEVATGEERILSFIEVLFFNMVYANGSFRP
jgi:hypothetical protein